MQRSLISPETFFSEEPLFADDGLLNSAGLIRNNAILKREFDWYHELFMRRCEEACGNQNSVAPFGQVAGPDLPLEGPFAHFCNSRNLSTAERVLLLTALEPHCQPLVLADRLALIKKTYTETLTAFSYYKDPFSGSQYPTLQTVLYLCAGKNMDDWRMTEQQLLHHGTLLKEQILTLRDPDERARLGYNFNKLIDLAPEYADYLLQGRKPRPDFGRAFPARWVTTNLSWDHLVLGDVTRAEISDVMDWVSYGGDVIERSHGRVNPSYPCLFYGPPGTGKSFAAKLIGKEYKKDVFRIDLSMIVSKYIGETEKNLAALFDRADGKDWILFFDEADALFGKRTGISDSKDKWANLEMSYLLQRMEEYKGLCILATNLKHNLDSAMTRRFQSLIYFPWPKPDQRMEIWQKSLPPGFEYPERISFEKLAKYDMSGAGIANVIKSSCIKAAKRGDYVLSFADLSRFIRMEYAKESRTP